MFETNLFLLSLPFNLYFSSTVLSPIRTAYFKLLEVNDQKEAKSLFHFFTSGNSNEVTNNIIISKENFNLLQPQIEDRIKKGTKFVFSD